MDNKNFKYLLIFIGIVSLSFAAIFIRMSNSEPLAIATFRMGISSIILLPLYFIKKRNLISKNDLKFFFLSGLFLALHFYTWITSLRFTSIMSSTVLVTTNPIFVSIFSYFLFKKKIKKRTFLAIILSIIGIILMSYGFSFSTNLKGNLLALFGALFASLYIISDYYLIKKYDLIDIVFPVYLVSFLILLSLSFSLNIKLYPLPLREYLLFFLIALIPQVIGHSIINYSLKFFSPVFISLAILGEPLGATIFGIIFFKEIPKVLEIIGGLFIITGIIISDKD
ncbi:MAG TPA: DMT family transporter [Caldisericia bacterium]|nr:DMT family transporter [Caldisericia bacterium]HOL83250.1 DMT family transporter [Caldisericia bacterium]HPP43825.1 DMT family transporter [Caldisericia bacterium]